MKQRSDLMREPGMDAPSQVGLAPSVRRVIRYLLRAILAGHFRPGDRIREVELATQLGVSRGPVREALRILEQDGLLELATWRGARVIDPSPREIVCHFDMLASTYGMVARFVVRYADDSVLERFSRDVDEFERQVSDGRSLLDLLETSYRMGARLGMNCGSALAGEMLRKLGRICYLQHRYLDIRSNSRWLTQGLKRMRRLEAALRERSEDRAEKAARRLVENTTVLVMQRLRDTPIARTPDGHRMQARELD